MKFPDIYVVYDTETTGLDTETARIVELAAKKVSPGNKVELKSWLIFQDSPLPEKTKELTGITDEEVREKGVPLKQALEEFDLMVGGRPLVGHNIIRYDNPLLRAEVERTFPGASLFDTIVNLTVHSVDTAALYKGKEIGLDQFWWETHEDFARRVMETRSFVKFNLPYACQNLGISTAGCRAHRAMGDVEMSDRLYRALVGFLPQPILPQSILFPENP